MTEDLIRKTLYKDGCSIHYWTSRHDGDRAWLVFLHGAGADHAMFAGQMEAVREHYNIMLWDARGHGRSRPMGKPFSIQLIAEDLLAIMNQERIETATLIGHSMGGNTAQAFAHAYPDRTAQLVLVDCTCNTRGLTGTERLLVGITPLLLRLTPWPYLVRASVRASSLRPEVQAYLTDTFNRIGKQDWVRILSATVDCLREDDDYRIGKPILLVYGEHDGTGNIRAIAPSWAASEPQCTLAAIPDASHCANQDNPAAFNAALLAFLNRHREEGVSSWQSSRSNWTRSGNCSLSD